MNKKIIKKSKANKSQKHLKINIKINFKKSKTIKKNRRADSPSPDKNQNQDDIEPISKKDQEELDNISQSLQTKNDRFYCTNANLLKEMYKWRNSSTNGLRVMKMQKNGHLIPTTIDENTDQKHEQYKKRTKYYIKYPKSHKRYSDWLIKIEKNKKKEEKGIKKSKKVTPFDKPNFYKVTKNYVIEDVTKIVEYNGWAFDIDDPLDPQTGRVMSENLGRMIMIIAQKISNHSYFRNYSLELKQDCQSYSYEKIIKGLFNYSFRYSNAFAYLTQACFNSFKSILAKHYKQLNIKRNLIKKAMVDLDVAIPGSSMRKSLNNQFEGNDYDSFQEF